MSELGKLRGEAMEWARDGLPEQAIRDRLLARLKADDELTDATLASWASHTAADAASTAIQKSGAVSRAPAVLDLLQERMPWADLPAQIGYDRMRTYVHRMSGISERRERFVRILAALDPVWIIRGLGQCETLRAACLAGGVAAVDVEALSA